MLFALDRRAFCRDACRLSSAAAVAAFLPACGGDSPTAPTMTTPPVGGGGPPAPPETPPEPPPPTPPNPAPPQPSGPASLLPIVTSSLAGGSVVVPINGASPLVNAGGAALTEVLVGSVYRFILIARTGAETFSALNGVCTHEACTVTRFAAPIFECPCHGSRYDTGGNVVRGPAPAALPRLESRFDGNTLTIRV